MIHETAIVHETAAIGRAVEVGAGTIIGSFVSINAPATIGANCRIASGARIGQWGFGYEQVDGRWELKPQDELAGVVIEDDVHIGANACIDRGSYRDTRIGAGTRIDNLVHIAHNVIVGRNCLIIAQAMLAGSVELGDGAYVAPAAAVREHLELGPGAFVGLGSVVVKDVPAGVTVYGVPARPR